MDVTLYGTNQIVFVLSIFLGLRSLRGTASAWHFMFPRAKILAGISFYPPNLEGCQFWLKAPLHLGSAGRKLPNWQKRSGIHRAGKQSSLFKDRNLGLNGESEHGSFFCPCRAKDCGGGMWWWKIRHFCWRQAIMGCSADASVACAGIPVQGYMYRIQGRQKINVNFVKQQPPGLACCC